MILFPNAKINIGLNVTSKRKDGFHEIESIFYPIPIEDGLEAIPSNQLQFECEGASLSKNASENTILKAHELLKSYQEIRPVHFFLLKNIPQEAGLGGGSANGTFALTLLNKLFQLGLSQETLKTLSEQIGSDCPFFLYNSPRLVTGRGEKIEPVDLDLSGYYYIVVSHSTRISTKEAYQNIEPVKPNYSLKNAIQKPIEEWKGVITNDFEDYVLKKYPELAAIKHELYQQGALYASLTGSGSAIYGIFKQPTDLADHFKPYYQFFEGAFN